MTTYTINNDYGVGAAHLPADTHRVVVAMRPTVFLSLCTPVELNAHEHNTINWIKHRLVYPGIGSPVLYLGNQDLPTVIAHNGRHRMLALLQVQGDLPVETHIVPLNHADLSQGIVSQLGEFHTGPLFDFIHTA
jgi:hypothetical protein